MRGIGDRIGLARFIGIGFAAVTFLFASGNHLGATHGGLLDDADELTRLSRTEVARLRADARPIGAIADDDLSLTAALVTANRPAGEALSKGSMIVVDIEHTLPADEIEDVVRTAGGRVYNHISESLLEAFVPASEVGQLQAQPAIGFVQSPPTPVELVDLAGSVSGESAAKANAPAWHSAGYRGNGVAVGIIDSFHGSAWDPAAAAGNVPLPASVFCRIGGSVCDLWSVSPGAQHGTAVAEVIHDMAPAAALHLADAYTPGDYIAAIDHFAAQGVRVINHSRSWSFDGPGDGTGAAAGIVNYAASRGILWVNAAGNLGDGGYWRGAWADGNGNNWLNFTSTDEVMGFICHPGLGLRWDDWATSGRTDYDIYIWDNASDVGDPLLAKASSVADQTAGAAPIEDWGSSILGAGCSGSADVDYLAINAFSPGGGTSGDVLEIGVVALGEYWSAAHSAAIPFADSYSAAMVAVGAVDPPTGSSAGSYSSQGPTNDSRLKPDLSAAAGVTSQTYGSFSGTSASAPAVAGATALLFQAGVITSATHGVDYLLSGAATLDRGAPGPDNVYGVGELRLPSPPAGPPPKGGEPVGLVDSAAGAWHLRNSAGSVSSFFYGNPGDYPFVGDWDCDGIDTPGLYRQSDGFVYLRNANSQGVANIRFFFGNPGDVPLAGDFDNDGCDSVSIYRPGEARIFVINELGSNDGGLGGAEFSYIFGNPGDKPFVGDFDGDGTDTVGLHRESTGFVYFRNSHSQGVANAEFFFGDPGDRLVAGDWGVVDGIDTPAIFRPANATFYFRHTNTQGNADSQLTWGSGPWLPVAGRF